ncbi:MAG: HEAT repeat domain-containing protein [Rhodopirellula sp. JB044]|uniref:HEAT repeat domain-containing protein n=1 Tax=Rhodopirellula sp. JB044 TaxID=3342844 RepID=UPI00370A0E52
MFARTIILCLSLFSASYAFTTSHGDEIPSETEMIAALSSDETSQAEKAITCKRLAVFGSSQCVETVATLLPDPELNSWARITLEAIDDPTADAALLNALSATEDLARVGVIQSLGVKRVHEAVGPLTEQLANEDVRIAQAAAFSLGKIASDNTSGVNTANDDAISALEASLSDARMSVRSAAAEGLIRAAEHAMRVANSPSETAHRLYHLVRQSDLPLPRIVEATRGAILSRGVDGIDLLMESLQSENKRIRYIALTAARELDGDGVTEALLAARPRVPASQAALFVIALGDRNDAAMLDAMLETIRTPPRSDTDIDIQTAAIGVVSKIGNASCLDTLLTAAVSENAVIASAGGAALATFGDEAVDSEIRSRARSASGKELAALIKAIGARRISAIDVLVDAVDNSSPLVQTNAIAALANVATLDEIPLLIELAFENQTATSAAIKENAKQSLRAAAVRMSDSPQCVKQLEDAMQRVDPESQLAIIETFAAMGGPGALSAIENAAMSDDLKRQDAATRLLGNWMTVDAADVLMKIAQQPNHPYRIRAVRGYLRIVRQFRMRNKDRNAMVAAAITIADRDEEKRLILDAANRYPNVAMLRIAVGLSESESLKSEAQATALKIAQELDRTPVVEQLLAKMDLREVDIEIVRATYGSSSENVDVTARLQKLAGKLPIILLDNPNYNSTFGGDPAPGAKKELHIEYRIDGLPGNVTFDENAAIVFPLPR